MIERTGPGDKPPRQAPDFAKKHPIRSALSNLVAIAFGIVILICALALLFTLLAAIVGR